jgi:hypothetical protein
MDKPKKNPILLNQKQDYKLCLNCGFPNRNSDTRCMYCNASLVEDTGLAAWMRQTYYILRWRWQLRRRRSSLGHTQRQYSLLKSLGFFMVGLVLSGFGVYIFTQAIAEQSFANGLIAFFFLIYGFITLRYLLFRK